MTSTFDKLNLKPGERRLVVFVVLIVFFVLNAFFVWPKFFEWSKVDARRKSAGTTLDQFQREVDRVPQYQRRLRELEKAGAAVGSEDQASKLQTTVYSQAALSGVQINNYSPTISRGLGSTGKTNLFFEESSATIQFVAEEKSLVDFLYNLGVGGSMIRVRQMMLSPDQPRQRLQGSITLVASFARKAPTRGGAVAAATTASPAQPAAPAPAHPPARPATTPTTAPQPARSINESLKPAATNAPPKKKTSWLSRLWPLSKKPPGATTNAPARTDAPSNK